MGQLRYGDSTVLDIDDATLAYAQVVIVGKLRLHENLVVAWTDNDTGVRTSLWVHPDAQLAFIYTEPTPPEIDAARARHLRTQVDDAGTLRLPACAKPMTEISGEGSACSGVVGQGASGRP